MCQNDMKSLRTTSTRAGVLWLAMTCRTSLLILVLGMLAGPAVAVEIPSIRVERLHDDFGDVHAGTKAERRIIVSNKGTAPLVIEYLETTCACTTAVAASQTIAPSEKTEIVVVYDTTELHTGKTTQAVKIHSNDPKQPVVSVRLYANVLRDIEFKPHHLVSKLTDFQNPITFSLLVKNTSDRPVTLHLRKTEGSLAKAVLVPDQVIIRPQSQSQASVHVYLSDEEKRKSYSGKVVIATDHPRESETVLRCVIRFQDKPGGGSASR